MAQLQNIFFSSVYAMYATFFGKCFLFHHENWKRLFFLKVYWCAEVFLDLFVVAFFETSVLKEAPVLHYLLNNKAILIPEFKKAVLYYPLLKFLYFLVFVFNTALSFCDFSTFFFVRENFIL